MYPEKVLQGIPDRKGTGNFCILNLLIMPQTNFKIIRHLLLGHALCLTCRLQVSAHVFHPIFVQNFYTPDTVSLNEQEVS